MILIIVEALNALKPRKHNFEATVSLPHQRPYLLRQLEILPSIEIEEVVSLV